jgi:probable phosphoglycerate mutase
LVLVRHGESVWNVERRVQGHECRGLTDHGRVQAERTAHNVAARWPDARVLSSDLGRCVSTATPIAAALGAELVVDAALRERHFGRWEGLDRAGLEQDDPARFQRWRAGEDVIAEVGGESDEVLRRRSSATFARLLADDPGHALVVVDDHDIRNPPEPDLRIVEPAGGEVSAHAHAMFTEPLARDCLDRIEHRGVLPEVPREILILHDVVLKRLVQALAVQDCIGGLGLKPPQDSHLLVAPGTALEILDRRV